MKLQLRIFLFSLFHLGAFNVNAWVEPVDFVSDLGESDGSNQYTIGAATPIHRCDSGSEVSLCHRWGLIFEIDKQLKDSNTTDVSWTPKVYGDTYRLPTIKELVRLYDYTGGGLDKAVKGWIDEIGSDREKTWIISSSYRDIDGYYDNGLDFEYLQVFALNVGTGEVKTFQRNDLALCLSLTDAADNIGKCNSIEPTQIVYTIKVQRVHIKEQCMNAGMVFTETGCTTPIP